MSVRQLNPAEIQKDHAIVHFFALLAGIDEIDVRMRLLVSGIASFLRMDAVVLGYAEDGPNACRVQTWHHGAGSELRCETDDQCSMESSVMRALDAFGYERPKVLELVYLGRIIGYLGVARRQPAQLAEQEQFLLSSFQTLTVLLLANYRALCEIKEQAARLHLQNRTLDGISTIFEEALKCDTYEELGRACLQVAEEITGSKFGFIAELGADGLLHDIAISDPGWQLCTMYDKAGHRRLPGEFKVDGLFGRVVKEGRSLLTNTPQEHRDSIGTPAGHPSLAAFLGVPLIDGNRTVGLIAVANREGGYRQEEQNSLEALAPAVVEALQRKRTEQALIRSEKLGSVGRLAATLAHEINNPLAAAMNALYLVMGEKSLSPQGRAMAEIAERELRRAAQIARRSLGFYREPNSRVAVRIAEVLKEVASLYEPQIRDKKLQVRIDCNESATVFGNVGEMRQLFSNLVANCIDAVHEAGKVYLRVSESATATGGACVRITVADTGTGIGPEHRRRIFEPFFTTKKDVGTGLGLWISEQIVKKHSGTIRMRSRVGQGTVVSVTLPAPRPISAAVAAVGARK